MSDIHEKTKKALGICLEPKHDFGKASVLGTYLGVIGDDNIILDRDHVCKDIEINQDDYFSPFQTSSWERESFLKYKDMISCRINSGSTNQMQENNDPNFDFNFTLLYPIKTRDEKKMIKFYTDLYKNLSGSQNKKCKFIYDMAAVSHFTTSDGEKLSTIGYHMFDYMDIHKNSVCDEIKKIFGTTKSQANIDVINPFAKYWDPSPDITKIQSYTDNMAKINTAIFNSDSAIWSKTTKQNFEIECDELKITFTYKLKPARTVTIDVTKPNINEINFLKELFLYVEKDGTVPNNLVGEKLSFFNFIEGIPKNDKKEKEVLYRFFFDLKKSGDWGLVETVSKLNEDPEHNKDYIYCLISGDFLCCLYAMLKGNVPLLSVNRITESAFLYNPLKILTFRDYIDITKDNFKKIFITMTKGGDPFRLSGKNEANRLILFNSEFNIEFMIGFYLDMDIDKSSEDIRKMTNDEFIPYTKDNPLINLIAIYITYLRYIRLIGFIYIIKTETDDVDIKEDLSYILREACGININDFNFKLENNDPIKQSDNLKKMIKEHNENNIGENLILTEIYNDVSEHLKGIFEKYHKKYSDVEIIDTNAKETYDKVYDASLLATNIKLQDDKIIKRYLRRGAIFDNIVSLLINEKQCTFSSIFKKNRNWDSRNEDSINSTKLIEKVSLGYKKLLLEKKLLERIKQYYIETYSILNDEYNISYILQYLDKDPEKAAQKINKLLIKIRDIILKDTPHKIGDCTEMHGTTLYPIYRQLDNHLKNKGLISKSGQEKITILLVNLEKNEIEINSNFIYYYNDNFRAPTPSKELNQLLNDLLGQIEQVIVKDNFEFKYTNFPFDHGACFLCLKEDIDKKNIPRIYTELSKVDSSKFTAAKTDSEGKKHTLILGKHYLLYLLIYQFKNIFGEDGYMKFFIDTDKGEDNFNLADETLSNKNNEIVKNIIVSIFKEHWTVTSKTINPLIYTDYKIKLTLQARVEENKDTIWKKGQENIKIKPSINDFNNSKIWEKFLSPNNVKWEDKITIEQEGNDKLRIIITNEQDKYNCDFDDFIHNFPYWKCFFWSKIMEPMEDIYGPPNRGGGLKFMKKSGRNRLKKVLDGNKLKFVKKSGRNRLKNKLKI